MRKVTVGVAVALALVTSKAAADGIDAGPPPSIAAPAPVPVYAPTWSGFYIGAGVGGGAVVHDLTVDDVDDGTLFELDGVGGEGVFGTAIVGWDWQIGSNGVIGLFADYDFSDISTDISVLDGAIDAGVDHDNAWSVGGRLGWLATPGSLVYATAGYTEAQFEAFADLDSGVGFDSFSRDKTFQGYFVGGGIDTRLGTSNWFARLEYRFTEFDSESIIELDEFTTVDVEPSMHTGRLTLTYKFTPGASWGNWGNWGGGGGY